MPQNTYIKAKKFAALAVGVLYRDALLPNVVTRMGGEAFIGAEDDTVTFKLPGYTVARDYEWRTRTAPIVLDKIGRTSVAVKLDTHTYSAVPITDEELTLDIESFGTDVVIPQVQAIGDRLERKVMAGLRAAPFKTTNLNAAEASDEPFKWALKVAGLLNKQGTPQGGRVLLVGANPWAWLASDPNMTKYDTSQAQTAYREATFGRIGGMDVVTGSLVGDNEIFALHPSWAVLANLAPDIPEGVTYGARRGYQGYNLRVIRDYDTNFARDRSFINTFTGLSSVNDELQIDANGLVLNANGDPQTTGKNVRGARGTFTPTP